MSSFLSQDEELSLQESGLHKRSWYVIRNVSTSIFSVCRHYGGGVIQNEHYTYTPTTDELIRNDVLKFVMKQRREIAARERKAKKAFRESVERLLFVEEAAQ